MPLPSPEDPCGANIYALSDRDFRAIAARLHATAGIVLGENKRELVYSRVGRRLRVLGIDNFSDYLDMLDQPCAESERIALVNAITTNLTGFFRERHHFDALAGEVLPSLMREGAATGKRRLRIWSAGCSSGEEPYTIAMVALETCPLIAQWDARILATDIDTDMVAAGRTGYYDKGRVRGLSPGLLARYASPAPEGGITMGDDVRSLIRFRQLNLLEAWPMRGKFDVIFCRNVVIYFDKDTQRILFDRFADALHPGGWLFIGHSESLFRVTERFRHLGRTMYRKVA